MPVEKLPCASMTPELLSWWPSPMPSMPTQSLAEMRITPAFTTWVFANVPRIARLAAASISIRPRLRASASSPIASSAVASTA